MYKHFIRIIAVIMVLYLIIPIPALAAGNGNVDSGGGGLGHGSSGNTWSSSNEGVRITVVRVRDHAIVATPIDLTNKPPKVGINNFGKVSKIQYSTGRALTPVKGGYTSVKPSKSIPKIISVSGESNITAIKKYFCSEYLVKLIAKQTGMNYDVLINGEYKLLLEPIAYYKFEGNMTATTATEAALYNKKLDGLLRRRMVSLTHKNLPLSMFLEEADLGYPAWSGSRNTTASDADIISSLGLGIVRFQEEPSEPPTVSTNDYTYRVNTDVITAVTVSGGQSDPDHPTTVSFQIAGTTYQVGNVFYPEGGSQLVWVKWRTPSKKQKMDIPVTISGSGSASKGVIHVKIVDLDKNPPPNPEADDQNDSFIYAPIPSREEKTRADWSVWRPRWKTKWVDEGYWDSDSWTDSEGTVHSSSTWVEKWVDRGWWEFDENQYYATFSADMKIQVDGKNPTANGRTMKSGYGVNELVTASVSSNQSSAITYPQNAVSYFPEFQYKTYWRVLDLKRGGTRAEFEFQENEYSTYQNRTHFSPIWMPDGSYTVNTWVIDVWTRATRS
ncbi:hypothetical protein acsn021_39280 [Anaerocolumna cellulosilytica]|uniref:Uncharacterized protein n=1 Tax=Anaerocolumna cellulosilytica TaxID=433286 RepID=A0A6S6R4T6_9FIRM|nr:hypothetical protein [Anaerocolumna cellulosilytica]MBB5196330.1 hypothetical protein [Anaerocolumna cellulosilytica]BCJ96359.1 hypothetical protein acsn021_39280 [Anaerocolumna cellulosilytica]